MSILTKVEILSILADGENAAQGSQSMLMSILPLVLLFVVMYFLLIRPQKKKQKEIEEMRSALKPGNRIVTIGGFIGKVKKITDDEIYVVFGENSEHFVLRKWAVQTVIDKEEAKEIERNSKKAMDEDVPELVEDVEEIETVEADEVITPDDKGYEIKETEEKF